MFEATQSDRKRRLTCQSNKRTNKKLNGLREEQFKNNCPVDQRWIFNATNEEIPEDVSLMLSLGPKFGLPLQPSEVPVHRLLADVESVLPMLNDDLSGCFYTYFIDSNQ